MNTPSLKTCQCGEQVPANCVRCRECGQFLYQETKQFHDENIADESVAVWMLAHSGQQFGPLSTNALKQLFGTHAVPIEAMVWKPGMSDWIQARKVAELSGKAPAF
jgi:hypothetical protein